MNDQENKPVEAAPVEAAPAPETTPAPESTPEKPEEAAA